MYRTFREDKKILKGYTGATVREASKTKSVDVGQVSPYEGGLVKRIVFSVLSCSLMVALGCVLVWAQATAQVSGTAKDQSGAVLPGVEITVTQTETGIARNAVTNETGSYVLPNLALGSYRLEAGLPGFRTYIQTGIVLQVNSSPVVNVVLEVGQVTEQVEVQANAALVETRSSTLGSVIENQRILELPLNGRNVTDLIELAGGAVSQSDAGARVAVSAAPYVAVAGSSGFGVDFSLDGANHISFMTGTTMSMPFPDATQEFKVESSGVTAQRANSTAVSAVTKSGTNELHGNLFEFVRNDLFNARNYFATKNSTLKRNQFGGTIGGPIVKNRLFYFGGFQGSTLRQDPADIRAFVPTPAIMAGDWTAFTSPACNAGRQIALRAPFVNTRIDPALYSKPALYVLRSPAPSKPFPTTDNPCGEITYGSRSTPNEKNIVGKIDFQASDKHALFGRVLFATFNTSNPVDFNTNALQETGWRSAMSSSYTLGSTYLLSASSVHAFRLAVNRTSNHYRNSGSHGSPRLFNWCDAGVKLYCEPEVTRIDALTINGAFNYDTDFLDGHSYVGTNYSLNDDVNLVRGTHQVAFGVGVMHGRQNSRAVFASPHQFSFNGGAIGVGLADFMLGRPSILLTGNTNAHRVGGSTFAVYATDTWKATPKVTLNYGLRWEPSIPHNTEAMYNFDYERFRQGIKSSVFTNAPAGMYYRGDPGFPENGVNAHWLQLAPRVGLAWDVRGDGRTSVRASYSIGYIFMPGDFRENTHAGAAPWGGRVNLNSPAGGLEDPFLGIPGGNIFPYTLDKNAPFPPYGLFESQRYDLQTPYSQSWNLSIQRQIGTQWLVTGTYMGSNLMHLWGNNPINPAIYFPQASCVLNGVTYTPCSTANNVDQRRRFSLERPADGAKMGFVTEVDDGGVQYYHGMLLSAERRVARGVTVTGNYTFSHCIGPYATLYTAIGFWPNDTYANPETKDHGNCESDRRHIVNLTSVAETPQFSNPALRVLATGWRLSGIYKWSAGSPLNILNGTDRALTSVGIGRGSGTQRASQVLGDPYGDRSAAPLSNYLNRAAFVLPDLGTSGNIARNSIQGPGLWSFDMAASRIFRLGERQRMEIRAEAFNVTNSFRPGNPNQLVSNNTFGVIRTARDPRIMQFALKYIF